MTVMDSAKARIDELEYIVKLQMEKLEELAAENQRLEEANQRLAELPKTIAAGEVAGTAIDTLLGIMCDASVPTRVRLQAAENLLAYKTPEDTAQRARLFLATVFTDPEQNLDHRLAATAALRKSTDVRVMPAIERPAPPPPPPVDPAAEAEARRIEHERKRAHMERVAAENEREIARELAELAEKQRQKSNRSGNSSV
jgi:hypothetical protein